MTTAKAHGQRRMTKAKTLISQDNRTAEPLM
jgi:hypothetical protein